MNRIKLAKSIPGITAGWIIAGHFINPPFTDWEAIVAIVFLVAEIILRWREVH